MEVQNAHRQDKQAFEMFIHSFDAPQTNF